MRMCELENECLTGDVTFQYNSYIVRVYRDSDIKADGESCALPIYVQSFGNGVDAEDRLLELLEHPEWTILKHG